MYLHLTWSFIFLYFQSPNAFHTFLITIKWPTNCQNGTAMVSFPSERPKKSCCRGRALVLTKPSSLTLDTLNLLKLEVRTQQVQPVPFPEKLRLTGVRFFAELNELSRGHLQVAKSCLHKYWILYLFHKWRTKLQ